MKKRIVILISLVACIFLVFGSAHATPILDFFIDGSGGGSVSYAGGSAQLAGTGINVFLLKAIDTPLNAGFYGVTGALDFKTGASTGAWNWGGGPGSSITLTGTIAGITISTPGPLLSGSFGTAWVNSGGGTTNFQISSGSFFDQKNLDLLNFFGLPYYAPDGTPQTYLGNFFFGFTAAATYGSSFTSTSVDSGNIRNVVPEPGTLLLLGSGLMGLGLVRFRKKFRH